MKAARRNLARRREEEAVRIWDSHVHLKHGDADGTEYSAAQIVSTMDAAGIERSVVFAMSTTTERSVEMALEAVRQFPDRLIPYVYALPQYGRPVLEEIDCALAEQGFRGIKVHAGECTLAEYVVDPVFELAGGRGVPCLIDCLGNVRAAERLARAFPGTSQIVAHMGRYLGTDARLLESFVALAEAHENVFLDLSGVVLLEQVQRAVRRLGAGRLIFGTDGPQQAPDTASYARLTIRKIDVLDLADDQKEDIFWRNIAGLLKLM